MTWSNAITLAAWGGDGGGGGSRGAGRWPGGPVMATGAAGAGWLTEATNGAGVRHPASPRRAQPTAADTRCRDRTDTGGSVSRMVHPDVPAPGADGTRRRPPWYHRHDRQSPPSLSSVAAGVLLTCRRPRDRRP